MRTNATVMFRHLAATAIVLASCFGIVAAASSKAWDDPHVLADAAVKANPAIEALKRQIDSILHKADAAIVWADPTIALEYSNVPWNSWALDDSPMSGLQIRLQQKFTLPGKNDRRKDAVLAEAMVRRWELAEKKNQLRFLVKTSYWRLALVRLLEQVNRDHIGLVEQLEAAVRVKYKVGKVGQHYMLSLRVLKERLADDLGDYRRQERELTAAINAAMHGPVNRSIATPEKISPVQAPSNVTRLLDQAKEKRPLLGKIRATADWHRLAARRAGYERWPDVTFWLGYRVRLSAQADPGVDFFSTGVSVPLPFDFTNRNDAKEEQHLATALASEAELRSALDNIQESLEASLASWQRAFEKTKNYDSEIIPAAESTLEATLVAYQTDRADFASLYQAELQLLQAHRALKTAKAVTHMEQARVEFLVGSDFDSLDQKVTR